MLLRSREVAVLLVCCGIFFTIYYIVKVPAIDLNYESKGDAGGDKVEKKHDDDDDGMLPIIYYYTGVSHFLGSHMLKSPSKCPVKCTFTEDANALSNASAIIFHLPAFNTGTAFPPKGPGQFFVAMSMESEEYYVQMKDKEFMSKFDLKMTYHLDSDFPTLYISSKANYSNPPIPKTNAALATVFVSNSGPRNERNEYIMKLMQLLPIHSYGRYLHNMDMPEDAHHKKDVLAKYKFHLAFENSNTRDYVTEKIFHAFYAGTVPVYLGAPNIDDFCPSNHSIIKVSDFPSLEALAEYMKYLDQNEEEYNKYLSWKHEGFSDNFKHLLSIVKYDSRCRLCMKMHDEAAKQRAR